MYILLDLESIVLKIDKLIKPIFAMHFPTDQETTGKYDYATKTGHLIAIQTTFYSRFEPNSKTTKAPSLLKVQFLRTPI
jgi:hypothetical protein